MHLAKILRRKIAFIQHNLSILLDFIFPSGKHGLYNAIIDLDIALNEVYTVGVVAKALFGNHNETSLYSFSTYLSEAKRLARDSNAGVPDAIKAKKEILEELPHAINAIAEEYQKNMKLMQTQVAKTIKSK